MAVGWRSDYSRYKEYFLNTIQTYKNKPDVMAFLEMILSISAIVVFTVFAIRPTILTILQLNNEIRSKQETVDIMEKKVKDLQLASSILNKEATRMPIILEAVPETADPGTFIKLIENRVGTSGVSMLSLSSSDIVVLGKEDDKKNTKNVTPLYSGAGEVSFSFSVTGAYQNLLSFLKDCENLRRPFKFDSLAINSNTTDAGKVIIMIISGRIPYLSTNE